MDPTKEGTLDSKIKLSAYEWDDTKSGCQTFWQFMMDFSMLVRMTLFGDIIEDFLDVKCKRHHVMEQQPQWILGDPDLQVPGLKDSTATDHRERDLGREASSQGPEEADSLATAVSRT